jgi:peroxiredoxin Q/BCP
VAFAAKHRLPFTLLSDPSLAMLKRYGAWGEKLMYGKTVTGVLRSTVWIGKDGKVKKHWARVTDSEKHPEQVIAALTRPTPPTGRKPSSGRRGASP